MSGYKFPVMKEADALFVAESAPDWVEGDKCHRCRDEFSLLNRRHHCRNCGQIFCNKCSAKVSALPKYGIEKEVRVCDPCYESINVTKISGSATLVKKADVGEKENDLPVEYLNSSLSKVCNSVCYGNFALREKYVEKALLRTEWVNIRIKLKTEGCCISKLDLFSLDCCRAVGLVLNSSAARMANLVETVDYGLSSARECERDECIAFGRAFHKFQFSYQGSENSLQGVSAILPRDPVLGVLTAIQKYD